MPKQALHSMAAPANRALVFVCEECGKRAGKSKHASHDLASNLKRAAKQSWGKGEVRVSLTSCMAACPKEGISVCVVPFERRREAILLEADVHDIDAAGEALLRLLREKTDG
jgi:predicted metal-binding protein